MENLGFEYWPPLYYVALYKKLNVCPYLWVDEHRRRLIIICSLGDFIIDTHTVFLCCASPSGFFLDLGFPTRHIKGFDEALSKTPLSQQYLIISWPRNLQKW